MGKLAEALKKRFKTPEAVLSALGLDSRDLGADLVVGDSKGGHQMPENIILTRKAAMTMGAIVGFLKPRLAQDVKLPWGKVLGNVTSKNFRSRKARIAADVAQLVRGKLAKDASVEGLVELLDGIEKVENPLERGDAPLETEPNSGMPMAMKAPMDDEDMEDETMDEEMDEDPHSGLKNFLKGKGMSEDDIDGAVGTLGTKEAAEHGQDDSEDISGEGGEKDANKMAAAKDRRGRDDPPDFKGKPETGGKMVGDSRRGKLSGDASIVSALDDLAKRTLRQAEDRAVQAIRAAREEAAATRQAERFVRPWVGDMAMACDTADEIFKTALVAMGVDITDIHPSAYRAILERVPVPGKERANVPNFASDSVSRANAEDFAKRYPGAARIRIL